MRLQYRLVASIRHPISVAVGLLIAVAAGCAGGATPLGAGSNGNSTFHSSSSASNGAVDASLSSGLAAFNDGGPCLVCGITLARDGSASGTSGEPDTKVAGMMYADFPSTPVLDGVDTDAGVLDGLDADASEAVDGADSDGSVVTTLPSNAPELFGASSQGAQTGGPCLIEPELGALYPDNWLRPRFRWVVPQDENIFELRLQIANQTNPLVVYTTSNEWTMPDAMWDALRADSYDEPINVTIRGGALAGDALTGEALGSAGTIGIAPVIAPGTIVYWTPTSGTALKGFAVGDETVTPVLQPGQVTEYATTCIGCHNATPDGDYASFSSSYDQWANGFADIQPNQTGGLPPWLGAAGRAVIETGTLGIHTFSPAHWTAGDRIEITAYNPMDNADSELAWIDVEATTAPAMGILQRTGDPLHAGAPSWSHDGTQIAYVSTNANMDGRLSVGPADVYVIPYADKAGGTAAPLAGASDPAASEYYPTWSPDDQLIAFDKVASGTTMYSNPLAELYVVGAPNNSDAATVAPVGRLAVNDPPACTGRVSPGVTNSWPKWAPAVGTVADGRKFYWLVFSSTRDPYSADGPQLYLTALVIDAAGNWQQFGALYFWNQPETEHNHTPAWDYFQIPPPPPSIPH